MSTHLAARACELAKQRMTPRIKAEVARRAAKAADTTKTADKGDRT